MFKFRLQKVLNHRAILEKDARDKFLGAKGARISGESEIVVIRDKRQSLKLGTADSLAERIELQSHYLKSDDDERVAQIALGVLFDEEQAAEGRWIVAKQELQVIEKLREKSLAEWTLEEGRREQAELDEWAVLRRCA